MSAQRARTHVTLHSDRVDHVTSTDFPGSWPGFDDSYSFDKFKQNFAIEIKSIQGDDMEFDMIGVDASIANAVRRILIAEVPTMAIENAYVFNNSTVLPDEMFCHRIGLVPINVDPRRFRFLDDDNNEPNDLNTIVFELKMECRHRKDASADETDASKKYINHLVLSKDIKWVPKGNQAEKFKDAPIAPVHDDILLCEMRPGQAVDMELHCCKGFGKLHAKWSPVATASYRLMPDIVLKQRVVGDQARRLKDCFSKGVIELKRNSRGEEEAVVANSRADMMSREVLRHADLKELVTLSRKRDHFICTTLKPTETHQTDLVNLSTSKPCCTLLRQLAPRILLTSAELRHHWCSCFPLL
eukprot:m.76806 g.76806  ORF g.76806 m.76806 type:complete len:357 (-) comp14042_c0_seq1:591-1661(-)